MPANQEGKFRILAIKINKPIKPAWFSYLIYSYCYYHWCLIYKATWWQHIKALHHFKEAKKSYWRMLDIEKSLRKQRSEKDKLKNKHKLNIYPLIFDR